ncbi:MAG: DUF4177 domain-containing protein [Opitutales bacterium]|nr:DUF4177 domain-containing protein [Opitutales bacterium]MDG1326683.1 DUF4177 domain-containing protein [Opitutales bacterium]
MGNQNQFEYKTISISPVGIRIKGDDISEKLAELLNKRSNELTKEKWRLISILPSLKSEGAVAKLLVTFERLVE